MFKVLFEILATWRSSLCSTRLPVGGFRQRWPRYTLTATAKVLRSCRGCRRQVRFLPERLCIVRALVIDHVGAIGWYIWSSLREILCLLYVAYLLQLVKRHKLHQHAYADDTQICGFSRPSEVDDLSSRVSHCIDKVSAWMKSNRSQLKLLN